MHCSYIFIKGIENKVCTDIYKVMSKYKKDKNLYYSFYLKISPLNYQLFFI